MKVCDVLHIIQDRKQILNRTNNRPQPEGADWGKQNPRPLRGGGGELLGFVVMFHNYDYVSLFVSCFDIPVSLGNLCQLIASIYDRFYLSRLNKLFEEN